MPQCPIAGDATGYAATTDLESVWQSQVIADRKQSKVVMWWTGRGVSARRLCTYIARCKVPKPKLEDSLVDSRVGFFGEGSKPPPHHLGSAGNPSMVRIIVGFLR